ncbi:SMYD3 [Symbiodinium natans]|uniref:SMYD3 protein n=1 Tax=Symbiodinium natans TaxID=878477 RepID=A0A812JDF8_9DINO|nr:SMYD3 [Symbiodinium natans]
MPQPSQRHVILAASFASAVIAHAAVAEATYIKGRLENLRGNHRDAVAHFGKAACLSGRSPAFQRKCERGVQKALQHLEEQHGKYQWKELFKADAAALLSQSADAPELAVAGFHSRVEPSSGFVRGRPGLIVRERAALGELLFVQKAFVMRSHCELLKATLSKLQSCPQKEFCQFMSLFSGEPDGDDVPTPEASPASRLTSPEGQERSVDEEKVQRILQLNARSRITLSSTGEIEEKLWGLWPLAAVMNHSCRPNASFTFVGDVIICRAARDLEMGDEICCNYVRVDRPAMLRRRELQSQYMFVCSCPRCTLEEAFMPDSKAQEFRDKIKKLSKAPRRRDREALQAWAASWSFLYREIEYEISLAIKRHGKALDEDRSLTVASDELFERCWTSDHEVRRELRLKEQEEMRQNIARRQGQETGKPHNYTGPGRIDVYAEQLQRLLCGSFLSVATESARLWMKVGIPSNSARDSSWICQQLEETAPASCQHAFWAAKCATQTWKAFLKKEEAALVFAQQHPDVNRPPLAPEVVQTAVYARITFNRCYGEQLWLSQVEALGWPQELCAGALQNPAPVIPKPTVPRKTSPPKGRVRIYKTGSRKWEDFPKGRVLDPGHRKSVLGGVGGMDLQTESPDFSAALLSLFNPMEVCSTEAVACSLFMREFQLLTKANDLVLHGKAAVSNGSASDNFNSTDSAAALNAVNATSQLVVNSTKSSAKHNATATAERPHITLPACDYVWGVPKLAWAVICDLLAIAALLLCIPFLLNASRRRPYGAPILDFSFRPTPGVQKSTGCLDCWPC